MPSPVSSSAVSNFDPLPVINTTSTKWVMQPLYNKPNNHCYMRNRSTLAQSWHIPRKILLTKSEIIMLLSQVKCLAIFLRNFKISITLLLMVKGWSLTIKVRGVLKTPVRYLSTLSVIIILSIFFTFTNFLEVSPPLIIKSKL